MLGGTFPSRPPQVIDNGLILGSTLFGMGWALAGLCPGPALASISWTGGAGLVFLITMAAGMFAAPQVRARLDMYWGMA